jgi:cytosine/adenosine deaminase-related metal-dependent hydrolase
MSCAPLLSTRLVAKTLRQALGLKPAQRTHARVVGCARGGCGRAWRAAQYLGVTGTGNLRPGKRADCPVLDGNPLEDIRNTRRIAALYVAGAMGDRAAPWATEVTT